MADNVLSMEEFKKRREDDIAHITDVMTNQPKFDAQCHADSVAAWQDPDDEGWTP